jgi:hypothetical protein
MSGKTARSQLAGNLFTVRHSDADCWDKRALGIRDTAQPAMDLAVNVVVNNGSGRPDRASNGSFVPEIAATTLD